MSIEASSGGGHAFQVVPGYRRCASPYCQVGAMEMKQMVESIIERRVIV
jgi:hypothetical protein